jgi:hypothetical protein
MALKPCPEQEHGTFQGIQAYHETAGVGNQDVSASNIAMQIAFVVDEF